MDKTPVYVGIDVAKTHLDVALRPQEAFFRVAHDQAGIQSLVDRLAPLAPALVLLEASGGYEIAVLFALARAGLPVRRLNPRQARKFAGVLNKPAKTDKVDARMLARFAEAIQPELRPLPDAAQVELAGLTSRYQQLQQMITMEQNRRPLSVPRVQENIDRHLQVLKQLLEEVKGQLDDFIQRHPLWVEKAQVLTSICGVGPVMCRTFLAHLAELGAVNRKEIAALVGVAPFSRDSGRKRRPRHIWGGRGQVRRCLYMATQSAVRHNQVIRAFAQRLAAAGKPKKVIITACMRKLLTMANAMLKDLTPWCPPPVSPAG